MNLIDLTSNQLKRAASIKEQIESLNKELRSILNGSSINGPSAKKKSSISAVVKKKIAATQKTRWANLRRAKSPLRSAKPAAKKKTLSPATRAKLSAKLKAYWAAKKAHKK
jgi:hypothetical protein